MAATAVNPTRMELLRTKNRIKLAQKGHKLLKKKRDALIMQFFEAAKKARGVRQKLVGTMDTANKSLIKAKAITGAVEVESIADTTPEMPMLDIHLENVMGVRIPRIKLTKEKREQSYGFMFTSSQLDTAVKNFNKSKQEILDLVEMEETLRRLSDEITKTKRRVNALEYIMLPHLISTKKYIISKLEEMERENFFRLKVVKKKKEKAARKGK